MLKKLRIFPGMLAAFLATLCSGCIMAKSTRHIPAVENFELPRYMGKWYEIARLPHSFERGITHVEAEYTLLSDGRIKVINRGSVNNQSTAASGIARFKGRKDRGLLQVTFFYPFYGDYKIIYLDKDYQLAIVTGSSMDYVWILSRTPRLSPEQLQMCLKKLQAWNFAVELLQYPWGLNELTY